MRALGGAERALALMVDRARNRVAFGRPLAEQGVVREAIAKCRNEIDQARLLCEKAAWTIDQHGNRAAHLLVSQIKAVAPLGRWQTPESIADMIVFLSSDRAGDVTGQTVNVDGGQVMHW